MNNKYITQYNLVFRDSILYLSLWRTCVEYVFGALTCGQFSDDEGIRTLLHSLRKNDEALTTEEKKQRELTLCFGRTGLARPVEREALSIRWFWKSALIHSVEEWILGTPHLFDRVLSENEVS